MRKFKLKILLQLFVVILLLTTTGVTAKAQTNYAGVFDGSTYISVPNSTSVNLGSTYTIEAWVNYSGSSVTIIDKGNYDYLWSLNANNQSNYMGFYNANTGSWKYSTTAVPQNTWTHVAITLSGGTLTFYVNGVAAGTASVTFTQDVYDMNIGRQQPTSCKCNLFNGQMDELRIWNVARSQSEIQANMNKIISPSTTGLAAYYHFDEGSGTTLTDATANGNTGTWVGNSNYATSGVIILPNNALNFVPGIDYVSMPKASDLSLINHSFTVEMMVKFNDLSGDQTIFGDPNYGGLHIITRGGRPYLGFWSNDLSGNTNLNTGQWYHLTYQYDITTQTQLIYVNGILDNSASGHSPLTQDNYLTLGKFNNNVNFNGTLDELRIWNYVLTPSQITATINTELTGTESGLVAYYNFNQGTANSNNSGVTTLLDGTSNGNYGTLNNFTLSGSSSNWVGGFQPVVVPIITNWTGAVNNDWTNAGNWDNGVPIPFGTVNLNGGASNYPVLTSDLSLSNCNFGFNSGSNINLNGFTLTIDGGTFNGNGGVFSANFGSLAYINNCILTNFALGDLDQSNSNGYTLNNLTLDGSGINGHFTNSSIYSENVNIAHKLSIKGGATLDIYGLANLTLLSNASYTASVDDLSNGTINSNNNITVQRFIPQGHVAYRDLSGGGVFNNSNNNGSFNHNWQLDGATVTGQGIYITGYIPPAYYYSGYPTSTGIDIYGFDASQTRNPSLFTYANSTWSPMGIASNINLYAPYHTIDPTIGYRALVRGDRNLPNFGFTQSSLTNMNHSTLISNTGSLVYGDVVYNTGSTTFNNGTPNNYLYGGLNGNTNAYSFIANPYASAIDWNAIWNSGTNLYSSYYYFDPTLFNGGYATYVTYNAYSGTNSNSGSNVGRYIQPGAAFFVCTYSSNPSLTISESMKAPDHSGLGVFGAQRTVNKIGISLYKNINGEDANIDGAVAVFDNNYTKAIGREDSKKMQNVGENISIIESNDDLSIDALPNPTVNDEIALQLNQLVANTTYQLKLDANSFTTTGLEVYIRDNESHIEVLATKGTSFTASNTSYNNRFSLVFKATKEIMPVTIKGTSVFPNPIRNNNFNLQMNNLDKGEYNVAIYNNLGQEVHNTIISHTGGSSNKSIAIKTLPVGVYTLKVSGNGEKYTTEMIVK